MPPSERKSEHELTADTEADTEEERCLLASYRTQDHFPGAALHSVSWAHSHQLSAKKMPPQIAYRPVLVVEHLLC